jgi:hypothetical protein
MSSVRGSPLQKSRIKQSHIFNTRITGLFQEQVDVLKTEKQNGILEGM